MIHSTADVQSTTIGKGTRIWQFSIVLADAKIGENCNINSHCFIENDVTIGNNVTVKAGVQVWDGIRIDDQVFIGPNVTFSNDRHPRSQQYPDSFEKTHVHQGASIGANATILPGITIGKYAMIGAGSVVTKDIPPYSLWFGNPACHQAYICSKGHPLDDSNYCKSCDEQVDLNSMTHSL